MKRIVLVFIAFSSLAMSCTTLNKTMKQPNTIVNLEKDDFEFSEQLTSTAKTTQILSIDFERLFKKEAGSVDKESITEDPFRREAFKLFTSLPVYGNLLTEPTANYALYNMMQANEGYDVIFYPQYEVKVQKPILGMGFILKITDVEVKAKLAKIK